MSYYINKYKSSTFLQCIQSFTLSSLVYLCTTLNGTEPLVLFLRHFFGTLCIHAIAFCVLTYTHTHTASMCHAHFARCEILDMKSPVAFLFASIVVQSLCVWTLHCLAIHLAILSFSHMHSFTQTKIKLFTCRFCAISLLLSTEQCLMDCISVSLAGSDFVSKDHK